MTIAVELASNAPTNAVGVGGAPGEGVTLKAGVTIAEPAKILSSSGDYRMNIDKSNQTQPGADMDTIGHVGVTDTTTVFTLIRRNNASHPFTITTDATGVVWVCIGTDSGFESLTELYYKEIKLDFNSPSRVQNPGMEPLRFYPNPVQNILFVEHSPGLKRGDLQIFNSFGQLVKKVSPDQSQIAVGDLARGIYFLSSGTPNSTVYPFVKE